MTQLKLCSGSGTARRADGRLIVRSDSAMITKSSILHGGIHNVMGGRMGGWAAPRWGKRIDVQVPVDVASDGSEAAVHGGLAIKRWAL